MLGNYFFRKFFPVLLGKEKFRSTNNFSPNFFPVWYFFVFRVAFSINYNFFVEPQAHASDFEWYRSNWFVAVMICILFIVITLIVIFILLRSGPQTYKSMYSTSFVLFLLQSPIYYWRGKPIVTFYNVYVPKPCGVWR